MASTRAFQPLPEQATGDGRTIILHVNSIELSDHGRIQSRSTSLENAGTIEITRDSIGLTTRSNILTESTGTGDAGRVTVEADDVTITGVAASADQFERILQTSPPARLAGSAGI